MRSKLFASFVSLVLLSGCASTRDPMPVSVYQVDDRQLSCDEIWGEYAHNTRRAVAKIALNREKDQDDIVLGILFGPGVVDRKNAEGVEGDALLDRNQRLKGLAQEHGCSVAGYPRQPTRYEP